MKPNDAEINIKQCVSMSKQMLRLFDTTDHDVWLFALANQGARRLSTNETLIIKNCSVEIEEGRWYMPKDAKRIIAFQYTSAPLCVPGIFVDIPFFNSCGCSNFGWFNLFGILNPNGRWVYMMGEVADGTTAQIAYQALNTDCDGLMIVNEEQAEAIQNYVAWQFAVAYPENYIRSQIDNWHGEYLLQAGKCRGLAARRKFEQARLQIQQAVTTTLTHGSVGSLSGFYGLWSFNYLSPATTVQ